MASSPSGDRPITYARSSGKYAPSAAARMPVVLPTVEVSIGTEGLAAEKDSVSFGAAKDSVVFGADGAGLTTVAADAPRVCATVVAEATGSPTVTRRRTNPPPGTTPATRSLRELGRGAWSPRR